MLVFAAGTDGDTLFKNYFALKIKTVVYKMWTTVFINGIFQPSHFEETHKFDVYNFEETHINLNI